MADYVTIDQRWYFTEDRTELVPEGDTRAAFLYLIPGEEILKSEATRLGIVKRVGRPPGSKNRRPQEDK